MKGIVSGVTGGSLANRIGGAGGTALTRPDGNLGEAYIALLRQHLREAHQRPDGLGDLLQATVEFRLNADGSVSSPRIVTSSGNAAFDRSVLAAFRAMQPLPAPPAGTANTYTVTFKMRDDA